MLGQFGCEYAIAHRHGVHGVLHHGELAGRDRPHGITVRAGDTDGIHQLVLRQSHQLPGHNGSDELGQGGMVPLAFPNAGQGELAQPLFELVGQNNGHDDMLHGGAGHFPYSQGGRYQVRRMARVFPPVNVIVVQRPHSQGIDQGGTHRRDLVSADKQGSLGQPGHVAIYAAHDLHIAGIETAECTPHRIVQVALNLPNHVRG